MNWEDRYTKPVLERINEAIHAFDKKDTIATFIGLNDRDASLFQKENKITFIGREQPKINGICVLFLNLPYSFLMHSNTHISYDCEMF